MSQKPGISGKIGHVPPPGAPRESTLDSRPMTTEEVEAQMRLARAHEKPLAPFAPKLEDQIRVPAAPPAPVPRETGPAAGEITPVAREVTGSEAIAAVETAFAAVQAAKSAPAGRPSVEIGAEIAPEKLQPAASDSDSPSRGIPKANLPPEKQITGGFSTVGASGGGGDYIPLDGSELCTLAQGLLVQLAERLSRDLRFSIAVTYPRVRCRAELIVESYMVDSDFRVQTVAVERGETAIDVARQLGEEIVFVVTNQRQEVDAAGRAESPANALRAEMGVEIPYKQIVQTPTGTAVVDRRS